MKPPFQLGPFYLDAAKLHNFITRLRQDPAYVADDQLQVDSDIQHGNDDFRLVIECGLDEQGVVRCRNRFMIQSFDVEFDDLPDDVQEDLRLKAYQVYERMLSYINQSL